MRRSTTLSRPRLLEQLLAVDSHGLAVVLAPVGFGKTTLLGQWSLFRGGHVRWCDPGNLPTPEALFGEAASPRGLRGVVIDGVPEIQDPKGRAQLEGLIRAVAPTVPVLVAARKLPTLNLAKHDFPHPIIVTDRDLAFRPWEVAALFADVYDDPLRNEDPLTIVDRTGGWAATLRLWHVARRMSGPEDSTDPPAALDSLIRAYLDREVLNSVGRPLLRQLLRTSSVFDTVTAERMDLLLGIQKSHQMLTRIARRVDLVDVRARSVDGPRYLYQTVLRSHLRSDLLNELGPKRLCRLYDRAAVRRRATR